MSSSVLGTNTSGVEVTNISAHGFWIFDEVDQQESFLSFKDCPWFVGATVGQIREVQRQGKTVLHWPLLDVDLDLERIRHPERFPLLKKVTSPKVAHKASTVLSSTATSAKSKTGAGSALTQANFQKVTSTAVATKTSNVLRDGRTSAVSKGAAGSALSQRAEAKRKV